MTHNQFEELLQRRLKLTGDVLGVKAQEYASATDRLHNFTRSSVITGESRGQVCIGFFLKHLVSILDMVDADAKSQSHSKVYIDEKIGDAINYLILLAASLIMTGDCTSA